MNQTPNFMSHTPFYECARHRAYIYEILALKQRKARVLAEIFSRQSLRKLLAVSPG